MPADPHAPEAPASTRRHEMLIGLHVTNAESYARYRAGMTPLLHAAGGGFASDFQVAEQLTPTLDPPINRLFVIHFPNVTAKQRFFEDAAYLSVRVEHFEPAVEAVYELGSWERGAS